MQDLVEKLSLLLKDKDMKLATAESCTGGLLATAITHRAGSSDIFERGFVTYSNEAKIELLGVPEAMISMNGSVSSQVAEAMARGALKQSNADVALSVTGIAGPGGGSAQKPVGLVHLGYAMTNGSAGALECQFEGDRESIRTQATVTAMKHLITVLEREA